MYFDKPGKANTEATLKKAFVHGNSLGVKEVVVASSSGETARLAHQIFQGYAVTAVTYHCGFREPFQSVMTDAVREELQAAGVRVVQATHALSGIERAVAKKHSGVYPALLIADTLRLLGQGTKVAVEVTVMAADAGALSGEDVIAIGGTGHGVDTALVLRPACQSDFFNLRIREVICKPREF